MIRMTLTAGVVACVVASGMWVQAQGNPGAGGTPSTPQPNQPGQSGQPRQPGQGRESGRGDDQRNQVTLTGCVERDTPGQAGNAQSGQPQMFKLTNAAMANAAAGTGATGAASTGSTARSQEYRLMASEGVNGVNLSPHLNHQVRVVGTVMPVATGASSTASGSSARGSNTAGAGNSTTPRAGGASGGGTQDATATTLTPMLHVTALTMVSEKCSPR